MKNNLTIFIFLQFFFLLSCKKEPDTQSLTIKIDSFNVTGFDNIFIGASFQNITSSSIKEKGFCWSKNQNPTIINNSMSFT